MVNLPAVTAALRRVLAERGVRVVEGTTVRMVVRQDGRIRVVTDADVWSARSLVVTAGHGTNDVLARLEGASLQVPITRDRPIEAKYFTPPADARERFTSDAMPVIAYLDAGIYCHPSIDGLIDKVKIGYYHPPDLPRSTTVIDSVMSFVEQCLPVLRDARVEAVEDVDGCDYDLVGDDEFVLGGVPGFPGAYVGVGWRGTGYKFAPWVGRVLAELRLNGAPSTTSTVSTRRDSRKEAPVQDRPSTRTLQQRLAEGVVLGAEGYVFELERRGYIKAGP